MMDQTFRSTARGVLRRAAVAWCALVVAVMPACKDYDQNRPGIQQLNRAGICADVRSVKPGLLDPASSDGIELVVRCVAKSAADVPTCAAVARTFSDGELNAEKTFNNAKMPARFAAEVIVGEEVRCRDAYDRIAAPLPPR